MKSPRLLALALLAALAAASASLTGAAHGQTPATPAIDKAFEPFWKAGNAKDAERAADRMVKAGIDFDAAWAQLKKGRAYRKEKLGEFSWRYPGPGGVFPSYGVVEVPPCAHSGLSWSAWSPRPRPSLPGRSPRHAPELVVDDVHQPVG